MNNLTGTKTPYGKDWVIARGLPKTGQAVAQLADDDGDYEAGWWWRRTNATNRQRFVQKTITGDDVIYDRATGLMWADDPNAAGCNNGNLITEDNAIIYCEALNFAGYTDWRLPNVLELVSVMDFSKNWDAIWDPFQTPLPLSSEEAQAYWTSTAWSLNPFFQAFYVDFGNSGVNVNFRATELLLRAVRKRV